MGNTSSEKMLGLIRWPMSFDADFVLGKESGRF